MCVSVPDTGTAGSCRPRTLGCGTVCNHSDEHTDCSDVCHTPDSRTDRHPSVYIHTLASCRAHGLPVHTHTRTGPKFYACLFVCVTICEYMCLYVCHDVHMHIVFVCVHVCVFLCACAYMCICVCMCLPCSYRLYSDHGQGSSSGGWVSVLLSEHSCRNIPDRPHTHSQKIRAGSHTPNHSSRCVCWFHTRQYLYYTNITINIKIKLNNDYINNTINTNKYNQ